MDPALQSKGDWLPFDRLPALETCDGRRQRPGKDCLRCLLESFCRDVMLERNDAVEGSHPLEEGIDSLRRSEDHLRDESGFGRPDRPTHFGERREYPTNPVGLPRPTFQDQEQPGLAELLGVDGCVISRQHAETLQVGHMCAHGRNAHPNAPRDLSERAPSILLERSENLRIGSVKLHGVLTTRTVVHEALQMYRR